MNPIKEALVALWIALIAGIVIGFSASAVYRLFIRPDFTLISGGLAAFTGAFFAFLFLRLADFLQRVRKRRLDHFNALVSMERLFNEYMAGISDNVFVLPGLRDVIRDGCVAPMNMRPFEIDKTLYASINNIELLNKLFHFNDGLRKWNSDLAAFAEVYGDLRDRLIDGEWDAKTYKANAQFLDTILGQFETFLKQLDREGLEILAVVRIRSRHIPIDTRIQRILLPGIHSKLDEASIRAEMERIERNQRSSASNNAGH